MALELQSILVSTVGCPWVVGTWGTVPVPGHDPSALWRSPGCHEEGEQEAQQAAERLSGPG